MKRTEAQEPKVVKYCDTCGKRCGYSCPKCDKDWCAECIHKGAGVVAYWNSPFAGHVVAAYCKPCDIEGHESVSVDPLYSALLNVERLRREAVAWEREARAAELTLKELLKSSEFSRKA